MAGSFVSVPGWLFENTAGVQIESWRNFGNLGSSVWSLSDKVGSSGNQISGIVAARPPSLPVLELLFLIFSACSMPRPEEPDG